MRLTRILATSVVLSLVSILTIFSYQWGQQIPSATDPPLFLVKEETAPPPPPPPQFLPPLPPHPPTPKKIIKEEREKVEEPAEEKRRTIGCRSVYPHELNKNLSLCVTRILANGVECGFAESDGRQFQRGNRWREATKPGICLPSGFIVGFPKSGTTSLYQMLEQNPGVGKFPKETHFLTRTVWAHRAKGMADYLGVYGQLERMGGAIAIDGSPTYAWERSIVPESMKELFPNARIVFVIQEPGKRVESDFYAFVLKFRGGGRTFDEYVRSEISRIKECMCKNGAVCKKTDPGQRQDDLFPVNDPEVARHSFYECATDMKNMRRLGISFYAASMSRFFELFSRKQIFTIFTQELSNQTVLAELQSFLGLNPILLSQVRTNVNQGKAIKKPMQGPTRNLLNKLFEQHNGALRELLRENGFVRQFPEWLRRGEVVTGTEAEKEIEGNIGDDDADEPEEKEEEEGKEK